MMRYLFVSLVFLLLQGCDNPRFPQDQLLPGPFHFDSQWQLINFDPPLQINREGGQDLHLLVDKTRYEPHVADRWPHQASLQRSDGTLVLPEVVLIGDRGQEVKMGADTFMSPYDVAGITLGFSNYDPVYDEKPKPFPQEIQFFSAVRIRSNEPLDVKLLGWRVDVHPDIHVCGGRQCPWWYRWLE